MRPALRVALICSQRAMLGGRGAVLRLITAWSTGSSRTAKHPISAPGGWQSRRLAVLAGALRAAAPVREAVRLPVGREAGRGERACTRGPLCAHPVDWSGDEPTDSRLHPPG